ncbi:MAG: hypothetical protein ACXWUG_08665, partial [Polyangiales bacterium]
ATSCKERQPQVCLSAVPLEQSDAAPVDAQTGATQSTENTGEPDAVPMPCLAPPPATATATPAVCLSPMPPPKTKGS